MCTSAPVRTRPHCPPDGRTAVVTVYGVQGAPGSQLAVIDLVRDTVTRTNELGAYTRPHGVLFRGGSSERLVVTSEATNNVVLVHLSEGSIEDVPTNARASHMVAVDLSTFQMLRTLEVQASPDGVGTGIRR